MAAVMPHPRREPGRGEVDATQQKRPGGWGPLGLLQNRIELLDLTTSECAGAAMTVLRTHEDRDEIKARAEADFLNIYQDHGGRCCGKALHCIFHKDRNPSASIYKRRFHCFSCNLSLDVFAFVARAQRTDFKGALKYLADRYAVSLNHRILTDAEKREYARRRAAAEKEAAELVAWRDNILAALRQARDWRLWAYHRAKSLILSHGLCHPMGRTWADAGECYLAEYQDLDCRIATIEKASFTELVPLFRVRNFGRAAC